LDAISPLLFDRPWKVVKDPCARTPDIEMTSHYLE
jgi:hypothetical protein